MYWCSTYYRTSASGQTFKLQSNLKTILMSLIPVERWMLPDGIEEILPPEAKQVDGLRRRLLDLFECWGYDLVIPPMMEFTNSLLVGLGKDVDLLTFKVTDQLTGRSMGIRADMTPQIARIDAHSLKRDGVNRLCYAGHVLKTQMQNALDTRSPTQVGVELYGEADLAAELEVTSLLLDTFIKAEISGVCLDLGHVEIFRALSLEAGLTKEQEKQYFQLLQSKALTEIHAWVQNNVKDSAHANWFVALPRLAGSVKMLDEAREVLRNAPKAASEALEELEQVAHVLEERFPETQLYFDLSELTGYHYSTGLVFAAFVPDQGRAVARGGRYDHIGEVFGRARPAVGFTADLVSMARLSGFQAPARFGIFAPYSGESNQWAAIQALRSQGEKVIVGAKNQTSVNNYQLCDRQLVEVDGEFIVQKL